MDPNVERLIALLGTLVDTSKQLAELNTQFATEIGRATSMDEIKRIAKTLQGRMSTAIEASQKNLAEAQDVVGKLGSIGQPPTTEPPKPATPVKAEDIAKHFRTLVDTIQLDARQPRPGELATTLKSFDVEIKGLIVVENNEAHVVTPTPDRTVDPGQLSTIRMSFGSIPVLATAKESTATPSPSPVISHLPNR